MSNIVQPSQFSFWCRIDDSGFDCSMMTTATIVIIAIFFFQTIGKAIDSFAETQRKNTVTQEQLKQLEKKIDKIAEEREPSAESCSFTGVTKWVFGNIIWPIASGFFF